MSWPPGLRQRRTWPRVRSRYILCAKMFEEVAAKDHIKAALAKRPFGAAILFDEVNIWRKSLPRFRI